jgi:uncharacterized protein YlxP (DUF503 family)
MYMAILTLVFHLEGCHSLKDKRRRLSGIRERHGKATNLAICETEYQNSLNKAQWTFVAVANDRDIVLKTLDSLEAKLDNDLDAQIIGREFDWL